MQVFICKVHESVHVELVRAGVSEAELKCRLCKGCMKARFCRYDAVIGKLAVLTRTCVRRAFDSIVPVLVGCMQGYQTAILFVCAYVETMRMALISML